MFRSARDRTVSSGALALAAAVALACGGGDAADPDGAVDAPPPAADAFVADAPPDAPPAVDGAPADAAVLGANCMFPRVLAPGDSDTGDTSTFPHSGTANCSNGTGGNPDAVYLFDLGDTGPRDLTVTATVDEGATPPFDVVLHARTTCGTRQSEVACIDAGYSERLEILAQTGEVYVFVDGTPQHGGATTGAYDLTTSVRDVVATTAACDPAAIANRCEAGARCVGSVCVADSAALACTEATTLDVSSGSAQAIATTYGYAADHYQGSCGFASGQPEHIYTFTLAAQSDLSATTDNAGTNFDTYLYLRSAACDGAELGCHDDVDTAGHNLRSTLTITDLPAGTYYLFVDGSSPSPGTGSYQLDLTVTPS